MGIYISKGVVLGAAAGGGSGGGDFDPSTLGTAAYKNAQSDTRDTTSGRLLIVGAGGLLRQGAFNTSMYSQFYAVPGAQSDVPEPGGGFSVALGTNSRVQFWVSTSGQIYFRYSVASTALDSATPWNKASSDVNPSIPATFDAPGATLNALYQIAAGAAAAEPGVTIAGSQLRPASIALLSTGLQINESATALPGTWRVNSFIPAGQPSSPTPVLVAVTRIDSSASVSIAPDRVRNVRYASADNSVVDCEIKIGTNWLPFTALAGDSAAHGAAIFNKAVAGDYGTVTPFGA
ncbi:hypothetical protein ACI09J_001754 [Cronobacter turicensis]